ncbi:MAG: hypothetical protein Q9212_005078 [Teloschistes hypoglaucus]
MIRHRDRFSKLPETGGNPYQSCIAPNTGEYDRLRASASPEWIIRRRKADDDKAAAEEDRLQQESWDREFPHDISRQSYKGNLQLKDDMWDRLTKQINKWTKEGKTPQQILGLRQEKRLRAENEREEIARAFAEEDRLQHGVWDRIFPTVRTMTSDAYNRNLLLKDDKWRRFKVQVDKLTREGKTPRQILESRQEMRLREEEDRLQQQVWDHRYPSGNFPYRHHTNICLKLGMWDILNDQVEEWREQGKNPWEILNLRRARRIQQTRSTTLDRKLCDPHSVRSGQRIQAIRDSTTKSTHSSFFLKPHTSNSQTSLDTKMIRRNPFRTFPEARTTQLPPVQYTGQYRRLQRDGVPDSVIAQQKAKDDEALARENKLQEDWWDHIVPTDGEMTETTYKRNVDVKYELKRNLSEQIDCWERQGLRPEDIIVKRRDWRVAERDRIGVEFIFA